jgi:hypothetical protein
MTAVLLLLVLKWEGKKRKPFRMCTSIGTVVLCSSYLKSSISLCIIPKLICRCWPVVTTVSGSIPNSPKHKKFPHSGCLLLTSSWSYRRRRKVDQASGRRAPLTNSYTCQNPHFKRTATPISATYLIHSIMGLL